MNQLIKLLLGNADIITYIAAFIFVFIGLVIRWYIKTRNGIKCNPESPAKFHFGYWLYNNLFRKIFSMIANFFIAFIILRFMNEIIGVPLSMSSACIVGILFDYALDFIDKWTKKLIPK